MAAQLISVSLRLPQQTRQSQFCRHAVPVKHRNPSFKSLRQRAPHKKLWCTRAVDVQTHSVAEDAAYCMPADVNWSNTDHPDCTVLHLSVQDYPGLIRVIAWVLNGLELTVESARIKTTADDMAQNTFWITNDRGRKLDDERAELVAERVRDFTQYCAPAKKALLCQELVAKPITIDNKQHEKFTIVSITGEHGNNTLLEIASTITGAGARIHEAEVSGPKGTEERLYRFWVSDRHLEKLNYERASALIYTLGLIFDKNGNGPLQPPGYEFVEV